MEDELADEGRIHELQLRVDELERKNELNELEIKSVRENDEASNKRVEEVEREKEQLRKQSHKDREEAQAAKREREQAESEKRQLLEALARSDSDKAGLESRFNNDKLC